MNQDIKSVAERVSELENQFGTHWENCYLTHDVCAYSLALKAERERAENAEYQIKGLQEGNIGLQELVKQYEAKLKEAQAEILELKDRVVSLNEELGEDVKCQENIYLRTQNKGLIEGLRGIEKRDAIWELYVKQLLTKYGGKDE